MPEVIMKEMQPVKQSSSRVEAAPAVKLVKKESMKTKAANLLRKTGSEIGKTVNDYGKVIDTAVKGSLNLAGRVLTQHTPAGAAAYGIKLFEDKMAQRRSEKGLTDIRAKAAEALGKANRTRAVRNASESKDLLNKVQIDAINKSNLPDPHKNALFEQDMRREGRIKGY